MIDKSSYLDIDARKLIYECVSKSPGIHFRELQRQTGLATGSLDYHVHFLQKNGLLRAERKGKFTYYFTYETPSFREQDRELVSLLKQPRIRHILIFLIENRRANATQIAEHLEISPSNLSFYLKTLQDRQIVMQKKKGRFRFYQVIDTKTIVACLITYKSSFLDRIVDSFIEAWEE